MLEASKEPSNGMDKVLNDALKEILPPSQQKQVFERVRQIFIQKTHSGPLPSEETVRAYEEAAPGSFVRIITMAEKDQQAVIDSHKFKAESDSRYRMMSLFAGLAALLLLIIAVVYLGMHDKETAAGAIAGMGALGLVGVFVNSWWGNKAAT